MLAMSTLQHGMSYLFFRRAFNLDTDQVQILVVEGFLFFTVLLPLSALALALRDLIFFVVLVCDEAFTFLRTG